MSLENISGTGDTGWMTVPASDRIEIALEGEKIATIRKARTDSEMSWVIDTDEPGTYVVIRVDIPSDSLPLRCR